MCWRNYENSRKADEKKLELLLFSFDPTFFVCFFFLLKVKFEFDLTCYSGQWRGGSSSFNVPN